MLTALLKTLGWLLLSMVVWAIVVSQAVAQPPTYLPWTATERYLVTQGNSGGYSHNTDYTRYGWDFGLPGGAIVRAAAPGTVSQSVSGCSTGDRSCNYGWGNAVVAHFRGNIAVPAGSAPRRLMQRFALVLERHQWFAEDLGIFLPVFVGDADHFAVPAGGLRGQLGLTDLRAAVIPR